MINIRLKGVVSFSININTVINKFIILSAVIVSGISITMINNAVALEYKPTYEANDEISTLSRVDEVYYLQPHNSYEARENGEVLSDWLNQGFRSLEIDVLDSGPWQDDPQGPYVTHDQSGADNACESNGEDDRLIDCLNDINDWLDSNESDVPLMLYIDMKTRTADIIGSWYASEIALLDTFISDALGDRLYRYQDLVDHLNSETGTELNKEDYRNALKQKGWPNIGDLQSNNHRVMVIYTGGQLGNVNDRMEQSLENGILNGFLCPDIDTADADEFSGAIDSISLMNSQQIFCGNVKAGDHYQVTANRAHEYKQLMHLWGSSGQAAGDFDNDIYAANFIAVAHGVSAIGIDPTSANELPEFMYSTLPFVGVRRALPGYFSIKSMLNDDLCFEVKDSYSNGADIRLDTCNNSMSQAFVYTAEGQLRSKGDNQYCLDFNSGSADNGDELHLWNCDGGHSEKWRMESDGSFKNRDENWQYCMDIKGSTASDDEAIRIWQCNDDDLSQQFILESLSDWAQTEF